MPIDQNQALWEEAAQIPDDGWLHKKLTEIERMLQMKRAEYGSQNIEVTGMEGISTRLTDKVFRLRNQIHEEGVDPTDTLMDIAGYALIGLSLQERGSW